MPNSTISLILRFLWRAAVALGVLIAVLGFFYTVENWRGRRAYQAVVKDLESQGESLDWKRFVPPEVPDDQNFTRTPFWETHGYWEKFQVPTWLGGRVLPPFFGHLGDWMNGQPTDLMAMQRALGGPAGASSGSPADLAAAARDVRAAYEPFAPEFQEWHAANPRPYSQFRFSGTDFYRGTLPSFVTLRQVSQSLMVRAAADLADGRVSEAAADLRTIHQVAEGLRRSPLLVSAMIRVAIIGGPELQVVWEGWRASRWTDAQLEEIQRGLESVNLIDDVAWSLRSGERAGLLRSLDDALNRGELPDLLMMDTNEVIQRAAVQTSPEGWRRQNVAEHARMIQRSLEGINPTNRLVAPRQVDQAMNALTAELNSWSPYRLLARVAVPNTGKAFQTMARNQNYVHMATVVCALERHRRAQGAYPETLAALSPKYLLQIPHDVTAGQPLKYRRAGDGQFILYSIGWNGQDDGGVTSTNRTDGDWVWPAYKPK